MEIPRNLRSTPIKSQKVVYFVHDLDDAAVRRRLDMLATAGASVTLLGFRRGPAPAARHAAATELGRTQNGRLVARAGAVAVAAVRAGQWLHLLDDADLVIARNLECLALAAPARALRAPRAALAFECLDIHRAMLGRAPPARALRAIEGLLLRRCDTLLVSSPAFLDCYFQPHHTHLPRPILIENQVLAGEAPATPPRRPPDGPPWRIGWFGILRCARSLRLLADLAASLPGQVEIDLRGRPARDAIPEFDAVVARTPGLIFHGPYDRRRDLPAIYGAVHFAWAMDFYEAGGNSDWLLPNRLYEAGLHGPVPLAGAASQTARWLAAHTAGLRLEEPLATALHQLFAGLTPARYHAEFVAMRRIPRNFLVCDVTTCNLKLQDMIAARPRR